MTPNRLYFALLNIARNPKEYIGITILSTILIFFISSIMLFSTALQKTILSALNAQPDFVVQKVKGEAIVPIKKSIADEIIEIAGTTKVSLRVWGRYKFSDTPKSILIIGIDFLDEQSHDALEKLVKTTNLNSFLSNRDQIIVGEGVAKWMQKSKRGDTLRLYTPKGKAIDLKVFKVIPKDLNLFANDLVIMDIKTAQKVFGLKRRYVTDITFDAPNELEWDIIPIKVASLDNELRVISKKESRKAYQEMFDYKGGFFLLSFLMVAMSFVMLLYERYFQTLSLQRKSIAILKTIGWGTADVLVMKFYETFIVVALSFILGFLVALGYVFVFDAPIIKDIFLGNGNFELNHIRLHFSIDWFIISTIFLLFAIPFFMAVLIPVWKIATTPPKEAMR